MRNWAAIGFVSQFAYPRQSVAIDTLLLLTLSARRAENEREMATERQIAANRTNAQRSTGPRSQEGKAAVRFNALTHGLTARATLLPFEDERELEALADRLYDELQPVGEVLDVDGVGEYGEGHDTEPRPHGVILARPLAGS